MIQDNKISIILPVHNSEDTIQKSIESVLSQTYNNYELIIINNGSNDDTKKICEEFVNQKIKYIEIEEANVSVARNLGIKEATGKYITFLDADDELYSGFLEEMVNKLIDLNSDLITCGFDEKYSKNSKLLLNDEVRRIKNTSNLKLYLEILKENYLFNEVWNKLFKMEIIKENNIKYNTDYDLGEDFLFVLDYLRYAKNVSYINKCLYKYTDRKDGLNLRYRKDKFKIENRLTNELEDFYHLKNWDMEYIYNRYSRIYYNAVLNIYVKENGQSSKEKDEELKNFLENNRLNFIELKDKVTDRKFRFFIEYILLKGKFITKIFAKIILIKKRC